ncbi:MAG: single-stranded DNA-binding protein [Clostridia bacterium]|nr:single-stranded DNA-binding protein [Clostridia bacterium]
MNKVILIGNLTRDPELRTTTTNRSVCSFSIAVNRAYATQSGERLTDFFNIVVWGKVGENCARYLAKGRKVAVVGELQNRSYEKDGVKRTITEIIASDVEFLTARDAQQADTVGGAPYSPRAAQPVMQGAQLPEPDGFTDLDDSELPF